MEFTWTGNPVSDGQLVEVAASKRYNHGMPESYEDFFALSMSFSGEAVGQQGYPGPNTSDIAEAIYELLDSLGFDHISVSYPTRGSVQMLPVES